MHEFSKLSQVEQSFCAVSLQSGKVIVWRIDENPTQISHVSSSSHWSQTIGKMKQVGAKKNLDILIIIFKIFSLHTKKNLIVYNRLILVLSKYFSAPILFFVYKHSQKRECKKKKKKGLRVFE